MNSMNMPLWEPTEEQIAGANITKFTRESEDKWGRVFDDYRQRKEREQE